MAGSPKWKVKDKQGNYVASCKYLEDAACLVALHGEGASINKNHGPALWQEGKEAQPAGESYDYVAGIVTTRSQGLA